MVIELVSSKLIPSSKRVDILWIGASQIFLFVVNFLLLKIMTSCLSVESFGFYSLCMTIVLFARQVIYDPISTVVVKKVGVLFERQETSNEGFEIVRLVSEKFFVWFVGAGIAFSFSWVFIFNNSVEYSVVLACLLYLGSNGAQGIYFALLNMVKCRKSSSLFAMLDSLLKLSFIFITLRFIESEVRSALIALSVSAFLVFLAVRWWIRKKFPPGLLSGADYKALLKHTYGMALPLYLPIFLGAFRSVLDRWILAAHVGIEELAAFTVLIQIGYSPLILIIGVLQTFIAPQVYALAATRGGAAGVELRVFLLKIMFAITVLAIIAIGISIPFSEQVFHLLVGESYGSFSIYLPVFIVCGAVGSAGGILHLAATGVFETKVLGRLLSLTVVINFILTLVLIFLWGFFGAIVALLLGGGATGILYWIALSRSCFCRG